MITIPTNDLLFWVMVIFAIACLIFGFVGEIVYGPEDGDMTYDNDFYQ